MLFEHACSKCVQKRTPNTVEFYLSDLDRININVTREISDDLKSEPSIYDRNTRRDCDLSRRKSIHKYKRCIDPKSLQNHNIYETVS